MERSLQSGAAPPGRVGREIPSSCRISDSHCAFIENSARQERRYLPRSSIYECLLRRRRRSERDFTCVFLPVAREGVGRSYLNKTRCNAERFTQISSMMGLTESTSR